MTDCLYLYCKRRSGELRYPCTEEKRRGLNAIFYRAGVDGDVIVILNFLHSHFVEESEVINQTESFYNE